jgi:hypothetical protein
MVLAGKLVTRTVASADPCPRCGAVVENRQMSLPVPGAQQPVRWVLASRRCVGGCIWIGDSFRTPEPRPSAGAEPLPGPRKPSSPHVTGAG